MINNRQFIILNQKLNKINFKCIQLNKDFFLNYHKNLKIEQYEKDILILGEAYSILSQDNNLWEGFIDVIKLEDILEKTKYWAGRWVLLWHEFIITDASALLNIYYSGDIISSSLNLIQECSSFNMDRGQLHISDDFGLNFFPSPLTPFPEIKRLMPSQVYNLKLHSITEVNLLSETNYRVLNDQQRVELIIKWFDNLLINLSKKFSNIYLTLTGGHDSRVMMALLEHANIEYETFIMDHPRIEKQDVILSQELSIKCNRKWSLIKRDKSKFSEKKYEDFDIHTFGMIKGDQDFYAFGQYPEKNNSLILRNSVWENVINWYETTILDIYNIQAFENLWINVAYDKPMKDSLITWINHTKNNRNNIDVYNKFFWEQRSGAWLASLEQGLDILDKSVSIQACNCKEIITLLYSFQKDDRVTKRFEEMIIEKACPSLINIQFASKTIDNFKLHHRIFSIFKKIFEKQRMFNYFYENWGFTIAYKASIRNIVNYLIKKK